MVGRLQSSTPAVPPRPALQELRPAMAELLKSEEWGEWEADLERMWVDEAEAAALAARHTAWQAEQAQRKQARLEQQLAEAAALENPQE